MRIEARLVAFLLADGEWEGRKTHSLTSESLFGTPDVLREPLFLENVVAAVRNDSVHERGSSLRAFINKMGKLDSAKCSDSNPESSDTSLISVFMQLKHRLCCLNIVSASVFLSGNLRFCHFEPEPALNVSPRDVHRHTSTRTHTQAYTSCTADKFKWANKHLLISLQIISDTSFEFSLINHT